MKITLRYLTLIMIGLLFHAFGNGNLTVAEALKNQTNSNNLKNQNVLVQFKNKDQVIESRSGDRNEGGFYQEPVVRNGDEGNNEYMMLWIKLIIIMAIFCVSGYLILYYLKKKGIQKNITDHHLFQSLAEFPLGINKKIQIVKIINDYYVLALGQDEVVFLSKVEDKESIDILGLESDQRQSKDQNIFQESLKNYFNAGGWSPLSVTRNLKKKIK